MRNVGSASEARGAPFNSGRLSVLLEAGLSVVGLGISFAGDPAGGGREGFERQPALACLGRHGRIPVILRPEAAGMFLQDY